MPAVKITNFLGTAPRVATELLPDTSAQVARDTKLYSGDLIPLPKPVIVDSTKRDATTKTLYALRDPDTDELEWLTWESEVDIVTPASDIDGEQRFYYTGDGAPKVSTYDLATNGAEPYPIGAYDLGLPFSTDAPSAAAASFTTKTTTSFARDAGNIVTLVTSAAHGLTSGAYITVSGFSYRTGTYSRTGTLVTVTITGHGLTTGATIYLEFTSGTAPSNAYTVTVTGADTFEVTTTTSGATSGDVRWDIRDLNGVTVEATVVDDTTLKYFAPGPQVATTASTDGKVDLGGLTQARSYLFTWYTPWDEESIGSTPSDPVFIKEGQVVTVSDLPTAPPDGTHFIRGIRLYRTLTTTQDADYFRLATLWFPNTVTLVSRTTNVSTITFQYPHNLLAGDRFKLDGCSVASFDIVDGIVVAVVDEYTFTYAQVAADVSETVATGTLYYDAAETIDDAARYWGDGSYDFTDDFNYLNLLNLLTTDDYDAPPAGLSGLVIAQNNILAGFVGSDLYFSEPNRFHAWPQKYIRSLEYDIVGLATYNGNLLVLTEGYPYLVSGNDPATMAIARIDVRYPCLSKRSIAVMDYGVVFATHDGLALYSGGYQLATRIIHSSDTWNTSLDPTTIVATAYKDYYLASHSTGSIMLYRDDRVGGFIVDSDYRFDAVWYDNQTNNLYFTLGDDRNIYQWDATGQTPSTQEWKSKTLVVPEYTNLGAARVVADFTSLPLRWDEVTDQWQDFSDNWDLGDELEFCLYVDKELIHKVSVFDRGIFRLPTGYKSDTFEVAVSGNVRVRAIHLGQTPTSLKEV